MSNVEELQSRKYKTDPKRYYLKDRIFDHPTEFEFYKMLRDVILGERFVAMVQIPLASLVGVRRKHELGWKSHWGRIKARRIDFLICRKEDLKPLLALELDGSTHKKEEREERDSFVDSVFDAVGLPVLHVSLDNSKNNAVVALDIARKMKLGDRVIRKLEAWAAKPVIAKFW